MDPNSQTNQGNENATAEAASPSIPKNPSSTPVTLPTPQAESKRNFLPWLIAGGVVAIFLVVIFGVLTGLSILQSMFRYTPAPPPPPLPPEVTVKPTINRFASDSAILELKETLRGLSQSVDSVDLIEPQIAPPALDLNINIKANQ